MKIVIRENNEASIHDQLDEQGIKKLPLIVESIHFLFFLNEEESEDYQAAKIEGLLFSLSDWGILDNIEDIKTLYDVIYTDTGDYRVEMTVKV